MSSIIRRVKGLIQALSRDTHTSIALTDTKSLDSIADLLATEEGYGDINKIKKLYENDSLTFQLVNYLSDKIALSGYYFEGDAELVRQAQEWAESIGLEALLKNIVKDIILFGTAWCELVPNSNATDIAKINMFPAGSIDFIRDSLNNIILEAGKPKGFRVITEGYREMYIVKEGVKEGLNDREVKIKAPKGLDYRDLIAWFTLERYGSELCGLSFIRPVYRSAIIRCNIADFIGKSAFRSGCLLIYVEGLPPAETISRLETDVKNLKNKQVLLLNNKFRVDTVPSGDIKERIQQIVYLADEQAAGMGVPLDVLMSTVKTYATDLETKLSDFELRVNAYQKILASQINERIISVFKKLRGLEGQLAFKFISNMPTVKLQRSRTRATYARRGLLRWDPELELRIRNEEGLPTTFVERSLEQWRRDPTKTPEYSKEIDVGDGGE